VPCWVESRTYQKRTLCSTINYRFDRPYKKSERVRSSILSSAVYQITASASGFQTATQTISYEVSNPTAYRLTLGVGAVSEQITVEAPSTEISTETATQTSRNKKSKASQAPPPPPAASTNVFNLQQRVASVLPVAVDVPRTGTSYRFIRPLVVNEETKLSFRYKSR
jgi:hypothetical protein